MYGNLSTVEVQRIKQLEKENRQLKQLAGDQALAIQVSKEFVKDKENQIREAAIEALGKLGDPRAVEICLTSLKDGVRHVSRASAEALYKLGWRPGKDENVTYYWIVKEEWEKCVEI